MPESASFSVRKKPNYRRRRTLIVLLLLVAAVVVLLVLPRGDGGPGKPKVTPVVAFSTKIQGVGQAKTPDEGAKQASGNAIAKMFTDYYQQAFVDPEKWGDGTFENLKELFVPAVQASFTRDLPSLTIGQARTELSFVVPRAANMTVTVYFDRAGRPALAVAATTFSGRGTLKTTGPPLLINQKATFYLQKQGDLWRITSYDADQTQETPPSPTPSPTPT